MCWHAILSYVSKGMAELSPATQRNYRQAAWRMLHHFGHFRNEEIEPSHCKQFLVWCAENTSALTGNRDRAFMSSVFEYAMGRRWAKYNPWRGVRRNKERPSKRYVSHDSLSAAIDRAPPELQPLLAVAYLTAIRQTDLRLLKRSQIVGSLILLNESKTGKSNEHEITPTVRIFLDDAIARAKAYGSKYVFVSATGLPWSEWGLQSALRRFGAGFRFRDLRAKAQTDRPTERITGHSGQMLETYLKKRRLSAVK